MSAKQLVLSMAAGLGGFTLARTLTAGGARILAYHGVDDRAEPRLNFDGFHVHPTVFEQHLRTLKGHYQVVTLRSLAEAFRDGRPPPPRAVAITFDDGYRNNLTHALPLLRKYELPATFFVTTGFIDGTHQPWWFRLRASNTRGLLTLEGKLKRMSAARREDTLRRLGVTPAVPYPMMTWEEVRALQDAGHEIGAHTVSHVSLAHESTAVVDGEVEESVARIAAMTGRRPVLYSYPYGEAEHFKAGTVAPVRSAGCIGAVTTIRGFNRRGADPFLLRRLNVTGHHDRNAFRSLVSGFSLLVRRA